MGFFIVTFNINVPIDVVIIMECVCQNKGSYRRLTEICSLSSLELTDKCLYFSIKASAR